MPVDTKSVTGRRELHFDSLDEIIHETERLAAGDVTTLGNWSFGQILRHLTLAMNASIDGPRIRVPFYMRLLGRLMKQRIVYRSMPSGFQLPSGMARHLAPDEPASIAEAVAALNAAIKRLKTEEARHPHPVFGHLTRHEWDLLHMRHAEMHLSFVRQINEHVS
jgi:hypothetical protein